jgi:hypothetical protein
MEIKLKRIESKNCYLTGKIYIDNNYICDTLEFNNELTLKSGTYPVKIINDPTCQMKSIYILDFLGQPVSKLVHTNSSYVKNISIRVKNPLIEIGLLKDCSQLVMFSYLNKILIQRIESSEMINDHVKLVILNDIYDNLTEEYVTSY